MHVQIEESWRLRLQEEFDNDKVTVVNAYMDSVSGELSLELKEQNG